MTWRTMRRSRWCGVSDPARTDGGHRLRDAAVAVVAGDLLDDVDLGGGVGPERRDRHVLHGRPGVGRRRDLEADGREQPGRSSLAVEVGAEDAR